MITLYLTLFFFISPAYAADSDLEQRVLKLEQEVTLLKQQVESLQSLAQTPTSSVTPPPLSTAPTTNGETAGALQLTLTRWAFRPVMIKFDTYYAVDVELHNGFNKAIREVEARIDFRDLRGDLFYSITISPNLDIPASSTVTDEGNRRNKRLLGRGHQMVTMKIENIKAELVVEKVVFDDGSILTF